MSGLPINRKQLALMCALIAALTAAMMVASHVRWYGSWGETSRALEDTTTLTYPAVAGIAAWFASGQKRRRYQWMLASASRTTYSVYLRTMITLGVVASAGFLGVTVIVGLATAMQANFGSPALIEMLPILAGFFAMCGLGVLTASMLPAVLSPIVSLVLVYAVEVLADTGDPALGSLAGLTVADPRERTYRSTAAWMLEVRGAWLFALAFLCIAIAARAGSEWLIPLCLACVTSLPLLLAGDTGMTLNKSAAQLVCHQPTTEVTVCLTAGRDHLYPAAWSALGPVLAHFDGIARRGWRITEEGASEQTAPLYENGTIVVPLGIANGVEGNAHVVDRKQLQGDFSTRLLQSSCAGRTAPPPDAGQPAATAQDVLESWVLSDLGVPVDGTSGFEFPHLGSNSLDYAPVDDFRQSWSSATTDERREWLALHAKKIVDCRLERSDLVLP